MPTALKAAVLQPISKLFLEWFGETDHFMQEARSHFEKLGEVVGTVEVKVIERASIDGMVMPWTYEVDGQVIEIPDDFVMARYSAYVIPKEEG